MNLESIFTLFIVTLFIADPFVQGDFGHVEILGK
ncbi:MAG: hypothetical protein RLZZ352_231 [Pseudomonadota bacterium]|jgi:hypothetical protein